MLTKRQVGLAGILIVMILASRAFFSISSIEGTTNVTAGIAQQHALENHFNDNIDSASSSVGISSQVSPYAGQEVQDIKSLSEKDVQSLQNGTGEAFSGMAKLAELNGYPGPRHVLDMVSELRLTDGQRMEIELIYQNMSTNAKSTGAAIIAVEQQIDGAFANKTITKDDLKLLLDKSADLYGQLRFVHLSAHLDTVEMLTIEQVQMYNTMRGYDGGNAGNDSSTNNHGDSSHDPYLVR
jgi:hypothetical protein